jgi:hypothetical protein
MISTERMIYGGFGGGDRGKSQPLIALQYLVLNLTNGLVAMQQYYVFTARHV